MKLQYYVAILVVLDRNQWLHAQNNTLKTTDKLLICSSTISTILTDLCDKKINIVKRDTSPLLEKLTPKDLQARILERRLLSSERWLRRVRRQIASECCDQPCTIGNLILYCSENAKLVLENPDIFE